MRASSARVKESDIDSKSMGSNLVNFDDAIVEEQKQIEEIS